MLRLLTFLSALFLASAAAASTLWVDAPGDGYLNLRQGPSVQYHVIEKMPHGSKVTLLKAPGKWVKVRHASGQVGWAHSGFLTNSKPKLGHDRDYGHNRGETYWVDSPRHGQLNLRAGPSRHDHVIAKMPHGQKVKVLYKTDRWYKLRFNGQIGWANNRFLSEHKVKTQGHDQGQAYWIDSPRRGQLNLRAGPSRHDHVIAKMPHGQKVRVLYKTDRWYKLRFNGQIGWANNRFLSEHKVKTQGHAGGYDTPHAQPTGQHYWVYAPGYGGLNLREGPGTGYPALMTMNQRDKVQELGRQGGWIHLRHPSGRTGWAHGDYLVKQDPGYGHAPNAGRQGNTDWSHKDNGHTGGKKGGKKGQQTFDSFSDAIAACTGQTGVDLQACLARNISRIR